MLILAVLAVGVISAQLDTASAADYSIVRIRLSIGSTSSFGFTLNGNYGIEGDNSKNLSTGSYTAKIEGGKVNLYMGNALVSSGSSVKIIERQPSGSYNYATIKTTEHGTNNYLGSFEFRVNSGKVMLINHIYLDSYLYGVVPHEMSNSWPIEALKAQAVAARTYAVRHMGGSTYDMVDTAANQVYKGFNPSNTNAIRAVDETAKTVLKCDGQLVQTFYAASNGGYVDIPQHAWVASTPLTPYHVVQPDPYDLQNTWSKQEVLIFPKSGSGVTYQVMKEGKMVTGSSTLASNAERYFKISALPAVAAKGYIAGVSNDIQIEGVDRIIAHTYEGNHGLPDATGKSNCIVYEKADVTMRVKAYRNATAAEQELTGQSQIRETVTVTFTINLHELDKSGGIYQAFEDTSLRLFAVEETANSWNLYQRRYGHGVGMSQRGAQQRARSGQTYQQILTFYYPNTYFETLSIQPPTLSPPPSGVDTTNATIVNCTTNVNVRSTPDTKYPAIGRAMAHARITVTQANVVDGWHKIDFGGIEAYISAYYVKLDDVAPTPTPTPPPEATPEPIETPTVTKPPIVQTATVTASTLNVRSGPGTNHTLLGTLKKNQSVEIVELQPVTGWHKIWFANQEAYVSAQYIKLASEQTVQGTGVVTASTLNIRSGAGTSHATVGTLRKGATVSLLDMNASSGWYKILYNNSVAYVSASYINVGGTGGNGGNGGTGTVPPSAYATVTGSRVNFRQTPSLSGKVIKTLSRGESVQILEPGGEWTKIKHGGVEGYISTQYLQASTATYGKVTVGVLNVRSKASTSSTVLGKLVSGDVVEIISAGGEWHKIRYKSSTAYVYASYIKKQ